MRDRRRQSSISHSFSSRLVTLTRLGLHWMLTMRTKLCASKYAAGYVLWIVSELESGKPQQHKQLPSGSMTGFICLDFIFKQQRPKFQNTFKGFSGNFQHYDCQSSDNVIRSSVTARTGAVFAHELSSEMSGIFLLAVYVTNYIVAVSTLRDYTYFSWVKFLQAALLLSSFI